MKNSKGKNSFWHLAFSCSHGSASLCSDFYRAVHMYSIFRKRTKMKQRKNPLFTKKNFIIPPSGHSAANAALVSFLSPVADPEKSSSSFSKETANVFYPTRYSSSLPLDTPKLSWMSPVSPVSSPFDLPPVTPSAVKKFLNLGKMTAPGPDSIYYGYPSIFLALTTFLLPFKFFFLVFHPHPDPSQILL